MINHRDTESTERCRKSPSLLCVLYISVVQIILTSRAPAQTTAPANVDRDLQTIYTLAPAKVALLRDGEIAQRLAPILRKQARFLIAQLHPWSGDTKALLLTSGGSIEGEIRPNTHAAFGLAVIARAFDDDAAREKSVAILRFLLPTHGAGGVKCADGKLWHDQWQSAHWAQAAGRAAWLLWSSLDSRERWLAARMICDEADRFIDAKPPTQVDSDTKAEENAWDSAVISLAYNIFPRHPHHEKWREAAIRWQISSFAVAKDVTSSEVVDGKPLKDWLTGPNLHADYTLENHDRVHPDYMTTIRLNLVQKLAYDWAGNPPPASILFNTQKVYASLKKLVLPDGGYVYPNGQDWHLHRAADWLDAHVEMAALFNDPQAARMARLCLETAEKMLARNKDGGIYASDETFFASSQAMLLELYADAYLFARSYGEGPAPVSETQLWKELAGQHVFEAGKFVLVRTDHSVATFSWGRQVMGLIFPLRKDLLLTPNDRSLVGNIEIAGKRDRPTLRRAQISKTKSAFAIAGELNRAAGAFEQRFAFVALADGRTIYVDSLNRRGSETKPITMDLGLIGILNDLNWVYHDGERSIVYDGGRTTVPADATGDLHFRSKWFAIDGLGIACLKSSGQIYRKTPSPIKARREQVFVLNAIDATSKGDAQTALVFYPGIDANQAQRQASACKLSQPDSARFAITLDDGKRINIDLNRLTVELP